MNFPPLSRPFGINNMNPIITIDGTAGAGKGTAAKVIAEIFGLTHVDTGVWYRVSTVLVLEKLINTHSETDLSNVDDVTINTGVENILQEKNVLQIQIAIVEWISKILVHTDVPWELRDLTSEIRAPIVNNTIARLADKARVRDIVNTRIREYINTLSNWVIVDGRDIGTVVFPQADFKLWLTASLRVRAERQVELQRKRGAHVNRIDIARAIYERDLRDKTRAIAPLKKPEWAHIIDTSGKTPDDVILEMRRLIITELCPQA